MSNFTVFLKNKNIIFKIRRSKVTDYAALNALMKLAQISWLSSGAFSYPHFLKRKSNTFKLKYQYNNGFKLKIEHWFKGRGQIYLDLLYLQTLIAEMDPNNQKAFFQIQMCMFVDVCM